MLTYVSLTRSTYYYLKSHPKNTIRDDKLAALIKEIKAPKFQEEYGYRRVTGELHDNGYQVNHKRVLSIMRQYNLLSKKYNTRRRRYNSYRGTVGRIADRLIKRDFAADKPYQKIVTDITEIKYNGQQKAYVTAYVDLYSSEVLSFNVTKTPSLALVVDPLLELSNIDNAIIHSDQGFHYQKPVFLRALDRLNLRQSMSRKATPLDNAPIESFFHILKVNVVYDKNYESFDKFRSEINDFIYYYNNRRRKEKLHGLSPVKYRQLAMEIAN
ncbi:IS3 family transposase [Weissella muntiaci]|uniref:IS3 family transposase n=1 Tax=Weissella muntiaci TaxID=2508881 RepID=A0A6C2C8M9_9LACO|nr:IS3 family transposase [Weissella muntiaci]